jgi:hypothetical protein
VNLPSRILCLAACLALLAAAPGLRAGSDADDGHDTVNPDEGPPFWGFVKDEKGVPVRDAKVSASYKNSLTLVTRTSATGQYRVRGFKKEININDIVITCAKDGYKQARVYRFPLPKGKPVKSVQTECRLQRL